MFSRTKQVIGEKNFKNISSKHIAIIGVGGVGGYIVEMFARLGVGALTIVDFDKIEETNINRQIIALHSTIGEYKVDILKNRILDINPKCIVFSKKIKITKENVENVLCEKYDYVIDAIDDIFAKIELIKFCKNKRINIICSLGTGNRYREIPNFVVDDIYSTSYDALAKKLRRLLKENDIKNLDVVYTRQKAEEDICGVGSVIYYPFMCAGTIVSFVVNKILIE